MKSKGGDRSGRPGWVPGAFTLRQWILSLGVAALIAVGIVVLGVADHWSFGEWLGVGGLCVSIAGFSLAFAEIQHTREVTSETGEAVNFALRAVASGRLATVITQLKQLVLDLEKGCVADDSEGARNTLNSWRSLGAETQGLLKRRFGPDHEHLPALRRSIRLASEAKPRLLSEETTSEATADALAAMSKTADALAPLLEEIAPTMEDVDGNG